MYLKEIRAVGFKSFAEKIKIELTDGISGIVGPNGSGKSNIVDAVRWVLGEQSVKSLRGEGSMADVIFSGSKTRKPASAASVTLVFDNNDHYLPISYTEVQIKRTIYKTGENEYYLNNEKCRLKDINDLFVDTGVDKESFNIISQGDIASVLSNKPEERRVMFEAAARVLKYKKRKDEALRKLDRTHENITRISDIIGELEVSLEPLKKQSLDAKKYLESKKKLDEIEVSLIVSEVDEINREYQVNKRLVSTLSEEIEKMSSNDSIENSRVEELKLIQTRKSEELYEMQQQLAVVSGEVEALAGKKNLVAERQKYDASDAKVHDNLMNLKENVLKVQNELFEIENNLNVLNDKLLSNSSKLNEVNETFNELKRRHDDNEQKLIKHNRLENETRYKIEMLRNSIENNDGLPYAVKNILSNPKLSGIRGVIGSIIETDGKYATAINVALGAACNYVVVDDEYCAKAAINHLKINKFGRATFFPLNVIKGKHIDEETYRLLKGNPDFIDVASNLVRYDDVYQEIIKNQLGTTIVVKDIDVANQIARKINYRYRIVTLDGELLHVGGSLTGGVLKNTSSLITQKHDLQGAEKELLSLQSIRTNLEVKINEEDDKYKKTFDQRSKILDEKTSLTMRISVQEERKKEAENRLRSLKEEENSIKGLIDDTLSKEEEKIIADFYEKEKLRKELLTKISLVKDEINELKEEISQIEMETKANNQLFYKKQQELKELEIKVNRADVKLDNLLSTLNEDYALTFERAKQNYFLDMDVKEARQIVDNCKLEIKKLGEVNLGAIEEYERVSQRHEFLTKQKEDLVKAQDTILEIIKELDDIMKERFLESFEKIKIQFKEVFKTLFGGGSAELRLTDPSNVLTTGIEISAIPPGKKLQHISLLSGGEKTLTAISLLFAILQTRPVPFCILDEVEAALDEVNVDNFGRFLKEFRNKTQFIVITHKKKTMEYADVLYGVTMQESGVSKLVSVKLEDVSK